MGVQTTKSARESEKNQMRELNERLADYIEKVRFLEAQNKTLAEEIEKLRALSVGDGSRNFQLKDMYEEELRAAREMLEKLGTEKSKLEVQLQIVLEDIEESKKKLAELSKENDSDIEIIRKQREQLLQVEPEINMLQRRIENLEEQQQKDRKTIQRLQNDLTRAKIDLENETMAHIEAANRCQTLEEEIAFLKNVHEQEVKELNALAYRDSTPENREFWKHELSNAIRDIQNAYDNKLEFIRSEIESQYAVKINECQNAVDTNVVDVSHTKNENTKLKTTINDLRNKLNDNDNKNNLLARQLDDLRRELDDKESDWDREKGDLLEKITKLQDDIAAITDEANILTDKKLSLELEIIAYRTLLEGGENRLDASLADVLDDAEPFEPENDAEILHKALEKGGVIASADEKAITGVVGQRRPDQLLQIEETYKELYKKDLRKDFQDKLSGDFLFTILNLFNTPAARDAKLLKSAMKGAGTNEALLLEILFTRSNKEIKDIKAEYEKLHKKTLVKDISDETSGKFKQLLLFVVNEQRADDGTVDRKKAAEDAKALAAEDKKLHGKEGSRFVAIFGTRHANQLREVFTLYEEEKKRPIEKTIETDFGGDLKDGFMTIVKLTRNTPLYFAEGLHASMKGIGTADNKLIRIVTSRCEIDMPEIQKEFQTKYKQSLGEWIKDDTSGEYQSLLLTLISRQGGSSSSRSRSGGSRRSQSSSYRQSYSSQRSGGSTVLRSGGSSSYSFKSSSSSVTYGSGGQVISSSQSQVVVDSKAAGGQAETLQKALQQKDNKAVTNLLGSCSRRQLVLVEEKYKALYKKELRKELEDKLSGEYQNLVLALFDMEPVRDAKLLKRAMKGAGTDEGVLIEILFTRSNEEIRAIATEYQKLYKNALDKDIADETSGKFKQLLLLATGGKRDESKTVDEKLVQADAKALAAEDKKQYGGEGSRFVEILGTRNRMHLARVFQLYERQKKQSIEKTIDSEFSSDLKDGFQAIVKTSQNTPLYFAEALQASMKGLGTKDDKLIRIVTTRNEVDMQRIKAEFQGSFKKPLTEWIKDDTSGDYQELLLLLIG